MDIRTIRKLINLIKETGVAEIEVKTGDEAVRINLNHGQSPAGTPFTQAPSTTQVAIPIEPTTLPQPSTTPNEIDMPKGHILKSPMVGTGYLSPNPGAPQFVQVGKYVNKGDTVCFIEAMKMFNQIEADVSGTIVSVLIENDQPIEYDQPLFIIDTDGK